MIYFKVIKAMLMKNIQCHEKALMIECSGGKKPAYTRYMSKVLKYYLCVCLEILEINTTKDYCLCLDIRLTVNISFLLCNFMNLKKSFSGTQTFVIREKINSTIDLWSTFGKLKWSIYLLCFNCPTENIVHYINVIYLDASLIMCWKWTNEHWWRLSAFHVPVPEGWGKALSSGLVWKW